MPMIALAGVLPETTIARSKWLTLPPVKNSREPVAGNCVDSVPDPNALGEPSAETFAERYAVPMTLVGPVYVLDELLMVATLAIVNPPLPAIGPFMVSVPWQIPSAEPKSIGAETTAG